MSGDFKFSGVLRNPYLALSLVFSLLLVQPALAQEGTLKWVVDDLGIIESSPALGDDGVIYFASRDDNLYAFEPDGTLKWTVPGETGLTAHPVIGDDGTIYFGNGDSKVFAVNPDGTVKWTFDDGSDEPVLDNMAIASDGTLYVSIDRDIHALNPDGSVFWTFEDPGSGGITGISIGPDGIVSFGTTSGNVFALDSLGTELWRFDIGAKGVADTPVFGEDGTVYVTSGSSGTSAIAIHADGSGIKWEVDVGRVTESASIGPNGEVYVPVAQAAGVGGVVALDPDDGSEIWNFDAGNRVRTAPAVGFDGVIYVGSNTNELIAINPNGTERWRFEVNGDVSSSPTIAEDGSIYFGSEGRSFYALNSSSPGLAATPWPKKSHDVRNTSRFGVETTRRRLFAPHVYWVDDENKAVATVRHVGGAAGSASGTTANFNIQVYDRDGSLMFTLEDSIEPGGTSVVELVAPDGQPFVGSAVVDASIKDGTVLAAFLEWGLDVSAALQPLQIGVFFSDPTQAARVHHFPAEATATKGLGIGMQNIGPNQITCTLEFFDSDGNLVASEELNMAPLGSIVQFFNDSVPEGFKGGASLSCVDPVVAVAVVQDFNNGGFISDFLTVKGLIEPPPIQ